MPQPDISNHMEQTLEDQLKESQTTPFLSPVTSPLLTCDSSDRYGAKTHGKGKHSACLQRGQNSDSGNYKLISLMLVPRRLEPKIMEHVLLEDISGHISKR